MDFRIIPESLPDSVKTEYLLRNMQLSEVVRITRAAWHKMDYGARNTHKIELWVYNEYDKKGNIDYLKHMINCGKLRYKDILNIFKLYNPFLELDPTRPIDWLDTIMQEKKKEEVFLTDDFDYVPVPKKIAITNPRWEHIDSERKNESANSVVPGDTITLMVDCLNLVDGALVEFTVYDTSGKKPRRVSSVKGKNSGGLGSTEWLVDDSQCTPETKYAFDAKAKDAISTRCPIDLLLPDSLVVRLHINPSAPESKDDTVVLFTDDESLKIIKTVKDDKVPGDAFLDLVFTGIKKDKKYSLVVDPGKEGAPYFVFENIEGKVLLSDDELDYSEE